MKYNVGDKVRIKSLDWYNENKDEDGIVELSTHIFTPGMSQFCGKVVTIEDVFEDIDDNVVYYIEEIDYDWTDEMIEGHYEEENIDCEKCGLTRNSIRCLFMDNCPHNKQKNIIEIPEDYVIKDENGNIIDTHKIVLEKKKPYTGYPKTYEECCQYLGCDDKIPLKIIGEFTKLINARNAYWKIAGEEMGLNRPWEPDGNPVYAITRNDGYIVHIETGGNDEVLEFPTAEMRDQFQNNFNKEIEICKNLL